jgi:hypothetical protein
MSSISGGTELLPSGVFLPLVGLLLPSSFPPSRPLPPLPPQGPPEFPAIFIPLPVFMTVKVISY